MSKKVILLILATIFLISFVNAETIITQCADLNSAGETYVIRSFTNSTVNGICLTISADNIILEGNGSTITNSLTPARRCIDITGRNNITVQNITCNAGWFYISGSNNSKMTNSNFKTDGASTGFSIPSIISSNNWLFNDVVYTQNTATPTGLTLTNSHYINYTSGSITLGSPVLTTGDNTYLYFADNSFEGGSGSISFYANHSEFSRNAISVGVGLSSSAFGGTTLKVLNNTFTNLAVGGYFDYGYFEKNSFSSASGGGSVIKQSALSVGSNAVVINTSIISGGRHGLGFLGKNATVENVTITCGSNGGVYTRYCIYFSDDSNNNILKGAKFSSIIQHGIGLSGTSPSLNVNNNLVIDTNFTTPSGTDVVFLGFTQDNVFLNVTYSDAESNSGSGNIYNVRKWYYQAKVQNYSGSPLNNVLINDTGWWSSLTDSTGFISPQPTTEYSITDGVYSYYNNHTFIARGLGGLSSESISISHNISIDQNIDDDIFVFFTGSFTTIASPSQSPNFVSVVGGAEIPTKLVDINDEEAGLFPMVYQGTLKFFSAVIIPLFWIVFAIMVTMTILAVFGILKKLANKIG